MKNANPYFFLGLFFIAFVVVHFIWPRENDYMAIVTIVCSIAIIKAIQDKK